LPVREEDKEEFWDDESNDDCKEDFTELE
jgi:hypothetical protein